MHLHSNLRQFRNDPTSNKMVNRKLRREEEKKEASEAESICCVRQMCLLVLILHIDHIGIVFTIHLQVLQVSSICLLFHRIAALPFYPRLNSPMENNFKTHLLWLFDFEKIVAGLFACTILIKLNKQLKKKKSYLLGSCLFWWGKDNFPSRWAIYIYSILLYSSHRYKRLSFDPCDVGQPLPHPQASEAWGKRKADK